MRIPDYESQNVASFFVVSICYIIIIMRSLYIYSTTYLHLFTQQYASPKIRKQLEKIKNGHYIYM